jgi:hypothetical protein
LRLECSEHCREDVALLHDQCAVLERAILGCVPATRVALVHLPRQRVSHWQMFAAMQQTEVE